MAGAGEVHHSGSLTGFMANCCVDGRKSFDCAAVSFREREAWFCPRQAGKPACLFTPLSSVAEKQYDLLSVLRDRPSMAHAQYTECRVESEQNVDNQLQPSAFLCASGDWMLSQLETFGF
eukprot:1525008-Amphidinium_carterae.1